MKHFWGLLFSCAFAAGQDSEPPAAWTATAALSEARHSGCAAPLADGRILVTGGVGVDGNLQTAELYHPDGAFLPAASMNAPRSRHTCTTLQDGRILVAGGDAEGSAEIYDPATDSWLLLAGTGQPRAAHSATLLPDNRVLLAGGESPDGPLDSLDLFDPANNTLSRATATLTSPRTSHVAVPLTEGRILLIAGRGPEAPLASTEIFNSLDDSISAGPTLQASRTGHSATLLDDGRILVAGGSDGENDLDSAEIFDPETSEFLTLEARLLTARRDHFALLVPGNGGVLLAGGLSNAGALGDTEIFLPSGNTFLKLGNLTLPRSGLAGAALSEGVILATGGLNADGPQVACGLLLLPALRFNSSPSQPGETIQASGTNFPANTKVTLSLDLVSSSKLPVPQPKILTSLVVTDRATDPRLPRVPFGPVPILQTALADAGRSVRLTAQAPGAVSAVASVPIKVPTSITLSLPALSYEGSNATFVAQISRTSVPAALTGSFSLTVSRPLSSITDGTSNTIQIGEQPASQSASLNLNTSASSANLSTPFNNLPPGLLNVRATYAGDVAHLPATATATYSAAAKTPTLQFTTSTTTPQVGTPFTLTASVSAQAATPPRALTGTVGFQLSGFALDAGQPVTSSTSSPSATVTRQFTPLSLDPLNLTASYSGDSFFGNAFSRGALVQPQKANSTLFFLNPPTTFACNQPLSVTARLNFPPAIGLTNRSLSSRTSTSDGGATQFIGPAGTLIPDPQTPGLATATLTFSPTHLTTGFAAGFGGDALLNFSTTSLQPVSLQPSPATVAFVSLPAGPVTGSTTLFVQVTPTTCNVVPTGNIEFLDGGSVIAVKPLGEFLVIGPKPNGNSSLASLTVSRPVGGRTFQARYSGDRAYQPATSPSVSIVFQ